MGGASDFLNFSELYLSSKMDDYLRDDVDVSNLDFKLLLKVVAKTFTVLHNQVFLFLSFSSQFTHFLVKKLRNPGWQDPEWRSSRNSDVVFFLSDVIPHFAEDSLACVVPRLFLKAQE